MIGKKGFQPGNKLGITHGFGARGKARSYLYIAWHHIFDRCYKAAHQSFKWYGGRGIQVCARWNKGNPSGFLNFVEDVGDRPSLKHSIDRINNDGHYMPSNIRWATSLEQHRNQRRHRGGDHKSSVLTELEVIEIKILLMAGRTTPEILKEIGYKVSTTTVNAIRQGRSWKHVAVEAQFAKDNPLRAGYERKVKIYYQNPNQE